jgi:ATP synthase F0 subunit b
MLAFASSDPVLLQLGPVSISLGTLILELVIFLATVWMMEALVFNPVRQAWSKRDREIEEGLAASSEGRDEAQQAREAVQHILTQARQQAQGAIDQVTAEGNKLRDQRVTEATEEFRRLVDAARQDIKAEADRTVAGLPDRIIDMALLAASRVTGLSFAQPEVRELAASVVAREWGT